MRLILLRHGESTWNAEGRMQGTADPPLSDAGRVQTRELAPLLSLLEPDAVVTSDLLRARQTAEELGLAGARADAAWREAGLGRWTGRLAREVMAEEPEAHDGWLEGSAPPPGGEAFGDTCDRIAAAIAGLAASGAERPLVVTHGGPIRAACATVARLPRSGLVAVPTASLTEIAVRDGGQGWLVSLGVTPRGPVPPAPP
ncbi:MAG TPA: histidine phosphatase family protein [Miltoncostaeaceae bacterium]|nr:histidine phosphatase family protein [Miltoncostaeaceae bacterium]